MTRGSVRMIAKGFSLGFLLAPQVDNSGDSGLFEGVLRVLEVGKQ
jgi:hypothetical protein